MLASEILSNLTIYNKYARFIPELKRRETWEEIVTRNKQMHQENYPQLKTEIEDAYVMVYNKKVLPSMRSLQFGGKTIKISPNRLYNCSFLPIDDYRAFSECMFLLLGGSGVGFSTQKHHVEKLPEIRKPNKNKKKRFLIGDNIEGWADSIKVLMKAYYRGGLTPDFDFSDIRPKGALLITSGGKAPGPAPLKYCVKKITKLLENKEDGDKLSTLECHDIMCFIADAVLAGGIRRAALISIFSIDDEDMLLSKINFKIIDWKYAEIDAGVDEQGVPRKKRAVHIIENGSGKKKFYDLEVIVDEPFYGEKKVTLNWVDENDIEKYLLKEDILPWYHFQPQRGRSNNSAVMLRHLLTKRVFMKMWNKVENSGSGEPGMVLSNNMDWGNNPCLEIALRPFGFCNLTTINVSNIESQDDLNERAKVASFLGTLQAGYTDFHYLRDVWRKTAEKDALLGVSMTGIASGKLFDKNLEMAGQIVIDENERVAKLIGINKAARTTCIKPEGTASLVLGCSSGIHAWHNDYYIRRMRVGKNESIYQYLIKNLPDLISDDVTNSQQAVIEIPQKAPEGAVLRTESPIDLLERVKWISDSWIKVGHRSGHNQHNVSCTVSIKNNEWEDVGEWMWKNRDCYNGLAVLPYDDHSYKQAPFEDCDYLRYEKMMESLTEVDLSNIEEVQDNTDLKGELACAGNSCEII